MRFDLGVRLPVDRGDQYFFIHNIKVITGFDAMDYIEENLSPTIFGSSAGNELIHKLGTAYWCAQLYKKEAGEALKFFVDVCMNGAIPSVQDKEVDASKFITNLDETITNQAPPTERFEEKNKFSLDIKSCCVCLKPLYSEFPSLVVRDYLGDAAFDCISAQDMNARFDLSLYRCETGYMKGYFHLEDCKDLIDLLGPEGYFTNMKQVTKAEDEDASSASEFM